MVCYEEQGGGSEGEFAPNSPRETRRAKSRQWRVNDREARTAPVGIELSRQVT